LAFVIALSVVARAATAAADAAGPGAETVHVQGIIFFCANGCWRWIWCGVRRGRSIAYAPIVAVTRRLPLLLLLLLMLMGFVTDVGWALSL
jgi:hypothetical protein